MHRRIPADAVKIIPPTSKPPPTVNAPMKNQKVGASELFIFVTNLSQRIYGGYRPVNTFATQKISNIEAAPRPETKVRGYGKSRTKNRGLTYDDNDSDLDDPIVDDHQPSPRKKRKMGDSRANQTEVHVLDDDTPPSGARVLHRSVEKPTSRYSLDAIWNPLAKSEFAEVSENLEGHTYNSYRSDRRTSSTSVRQDGRLGRPQAGSRLSHPSVHIDLSDDDNKPQRSPHERNHHVTDKVTLAIGGDVGSPADARLDEGHDDKSKYWPSSALHKGTGTQKHDTHSDFKDLIYQDQKKFKYAQKKPPRMNDQFRRIEDSASEDELLMDPNSSEQVSTRLTPRLTKAASPIKSSGTQKSARVKKSGYVLEYFATHGVVEKGPDLTLRHDPDLNAYLLTRFDEQSSNYRALGPKIEPAKATRSVECEEKRCIRLTGSILNGEKYWFDMIFQYKFQYKEFLNIIPDKGVKVVQKSR